MEPDLQQRELLQIFTAFPFNPIAQEDATRTITIAKVYIIFLLASVLLSRKVYCIKKAVSFLKRLLPWYPGRDLNPHGREATGF